MAKVYVLYDGEYDDRKVLGVFSSEEALARVAPDRSIADVEECELDPTIEGEIGLIHTCQLYLDDGSIRHANTHNHAMLRDPEKRKIHFQIEDPRLPLRSIYAELYRGPWANRVPEPHRPWVQVVSPRSAKDAAWFADYARRRFLEESESAPVPGEGVGVLGATAGQ